MRVYWKEGTLHVQPESDVETEAMLVILDALKGGEPPTFDGPRLGRGVPHVTPHVNAVETLGQVERGLDLDL